jgi:hypothetical protein
MPTSFLSSLSLSLLLLPTANRDIPLGTKHDISKKKNPPSHSKWGKKRGESWKRMRKALNWKKMAAVKKRGQRGRRREPGLKIWERNRNKTKQSRYMYILLNL